MEKYTCDKCGEEEDVKIEYEAQKHQTEYMWCQCNRCKHVWHDETKEQRVREYKV
jgi:uncharacterized Zn finger protein